MKVGTAEVVKVEWVTNWQGTFGFVITKDSITGEIKCRFGKAMGEDENHDVQLIVEHGSRVYPQTFKSILMEFENDD